MSKGEVGHNVLLYVGRYREAIDILWSVCHKILSKLINLLYEKNFYLHNIAI